MAHDGSTPAKGAQAGESVSKLLHILQHSLGRDQYGRQTKNGGEDYRNHFVAGADDLLACREAVSLGLMVEHAATAISGGDPWFHVTNAGKAYIAEHSPKPPKVSRAKRRYLDYLNRADLYGISFGEWLKRGFYREAPHDLS